MPQAAAFAANSTVLTGDLKASPQARWSVAVFALILLGGLIYIVSKLHVDLSPVHQASVLPYVLLATALLIALGFEFVNGFHDTANAVATVIYTHSLEPHTAVVWSGFWNFVGVATSSGAVAFSVVSLLPVGMILRVSRGSGFSMIYALLVAAVLWNLFTWWRGLPVSSSHTMIGSILGVALVNGWISGHDGGFGIDWTEVLKVGEALVFSPIIGFVLAFGLYFLLRHLLKDPRLFEAPEGQQPPPFGIRALLILTCTGVSYAHGSNDGQKGMGLIMLILVGTVPTAYALNHAVDTGSVQTFAAVSTDVAGVLGRDSSPRPASHAGVPPISQDPSPELERFISSRRVQPETLPSLQAMVLTVRNEAVGYGSLGSVPANMEANVRNQMYLTSETLRLLPKAVPQIDAADTQVLANYRGFLVRSTQYVPTWVKIAVALALSLGTMIGWKRIVITVGERIGKTHLTYAQGASAELVAMATILGASGFGLPVSTTHVLSSGVAGTMAASGAGVQMSTLRSIAIAWLFTLPAAALLSGLLFLLFQHLPV